ncbi:MAG: MotA/TolQ/ExbB proton channel family protein [Alphaproteobacteria bacterium]|nr:MotA/TolQ/ExbB proton channel family protein [Alphaproteobacteria bacterium]MCB9792928.1 MotA/TolQ/ExbB proton channel family protein [Alphaproteobacteria bacterium]
MKFDLQHIWEASSAQTLFILSILLIMGIASIYVGIERAVTLYKARSQSRELAEALTSHFAKNDVHGGLAACQRADFKFSYLGHMMEAGLREIDGHFDRNGVEAAKRAMDRRAIQETADLRRGMNILATVGSTAPFVGLVGTIFGIINAFSGMAESGSGGLTAVAGGIAEALVATAIGIFVAIVGVWLFNYFTARLESIANDITVSVQEFLDWCEKRLVEDHELTVSDAPTQEVPAK